MGTMDTRNRAQARKKGRESTFRMVDANINCQNDIKKLRRENEQLRKEIWGLRDEYDKLEEILKQQKLKGNTDDSDTNTDYSDDEDDSNEEDDIDKDAKEEERLDNKENQKLSAEEMHRLRVDFDELSVVDEEEEAGKMKESKDGTKRQNHGQVLNQDIIQEALSFYSIPYEPPSSNLYSNFPPGFSSDCPFIFPTPVMNFPEKSPEGSIPIPPCPPMYANDPISVGNLENRPVSATGSHLGSFGFPSVSDLENSSSEASVQTRSTKVASSSNLRKLSPILGDGPCSIPKSVQENPDKVEPDSKKPKHFFAPLTTKSSPQRKSQPDDSLPTPGSKCEKGSADIFVNDAHPDNRQLTFLSSENLFVNGEAEKRDGSTIVKSLSCHDLPKSEGSSVESKTKLAKSENALDSSGSFRTRLDITLKPLMKPPTPTTPEVPKLPSFDSKLFSNQYHRHFEQYRNYMAQAMKKPLNIQVPDPPGFCPGFYGFIPIPPGSGVKGRSSDNLEQYQALLLNGKSKSPKDIQVTSFETPSPRTLQIPPLTPYDLNLLYSKLPGLTTEVHGTDLYRNLPLLTKNGAVICPNGPGIKVQCETCLKKVPVQTPTPVEEDRKGNERKKGKKQKIPTEDGSSGQKRKERLRKQVSVASSETPEIPVDVATKRVLATDEKNESRSSSSGGDSPRKDHRRMSLYFNSKKRPSTSSIRTTKSLSLDINKTKGCTDILDGSDKEKSISNTVSNGKKSRKSSTSSESVPWCACWGNGCI